MSNILHLVQSVSLYLYIDWVDTWLTAYTHCNDIVTTLCAISLGINYQMVVLNRSKRYTWRWPQNLYSHCIRSYLQNLTNSTCGQIRIIRSFLFWKWALMDPRHGSELLPVPEVALEDGSWAVHVFNRWSGAFWESTSTTRNNSKQSLWFSKAPTSRNLHWSNSVKSKIFGKFDRHSLLFDLWCPPWLKSNNTRIVVKQCA